MEIVRGVPLATYFERHSVWSTLSLGPCQWHVVPGGGCSKRRLSLPAPLVFVCVCVFVSVLCVVCVCGLHFFNTFFCFWLLLLGPAKHTTPPQQHTFVTSPLPLAFDLICIYLRIYWPPNHHPSITQKWREYKLTASNCWKTTSILTETHKALQLHFIYLFICNIRCLSSCVIFIYGLFVCLWLPLSDQEKVEATLIV